MAIVSIRASWTPLFVLAAVLWTALAPATADAHEIHRYEAPERQVAPPGLDADSRPARSASPFCPGGSGPVCECGDLLALVRADETAGLPSGGWNPLVRPRVGLIRPPTYKAAPPSAPLRFPASPRAPPFSS